MTESITITINDNEIEANSNETIWEVASRNGIEIPHLCHKPADGYRPDGNCRACMVEIDGERTLAASCIRYASEGMVIKTESERATKARNMVLELLVTDQPSQVDAHDPASTLWHFANAVEINDSRFPQHTAPQPDSSHPAIAVNMDACIQCGLCVRACREVQVNDVIGLAGRGPNAHIVFDLGDDMGASTCVGCGECVQACPTGALMPKASLDENGVFANKPDRQVDSLCPYCGVGCQLTFNIKDDKILSVDGRPGPANRGRLCVKGRYGFDYIHNKDRLTTPMIRKSDCPKTREIPANPLENFRSASWAEALEFAASGLIKVRENDGGNALAGFGSAKGSNEEAYLVQKLVRTGFGTNNVDHCTRLCHASSVSALMETIGSGAVTAPFSEAENAEVIIVIGANPTVNHPVAATFIKNAVKNGSTLIVMDPRGQALTRHAAHMIQFKPSSDVAMLNGMINTIISEELYDQQYIDGYTEGFEELKKQTAQFTPERMAPICGIEANKIREIARIYAKANSA
ncbi:MAG: molybdopterin-dependent oxidoreductase, partial [Pseudomonadota bacterium]|nr:molybdopterin-dependent oxidoreductase [Pseudomonadota bacterium]